MEACAAAGACGAGWHRGPPSGILLTAPALILSLSCWLLCCLILIHLAQLYIVAGKPLAAWLGAWLFMTYQMEAIPLQEHVVLDGTKGKQFFPARTKLFSIHLQWSSRWLGII